MNAQMRWRNRGGKPTRFCFTHHHRKRILRANQARQLQLNIADHGRAFMIETKIAPWQWPCSTTQTKKVQIVHLMTLQLLQLVPCQHYAVLRTPLPHATPSPRAVWQALGLESMTEGYHKSGDKEARSPASWPLYLRLQPVPDHEPVEPVERVLFSDREDYSTDVRDRSISRRKRTKLCAALRQEVTTMPT